MSFLKLRKLLVLRNSSEDIHLVVIIRWYTSFAHGILLAPSPFLKNFLSLLKMWLFLSNRNGDLLDCSFFNILLLLFPLNRQRKRNIWLLLRTLQDFFIVIVSLLPFLRWCRKLALKYVLYLIYSVHDVFLSSKFRNGLNALICKICQ